MASRFDRGMSGKMTAGLWNSACLLLGSTAEGQNVNLKVILRIMRKLDLLAKICRRRPYINY